MKSVNILNLINEISPDAKSVLIVEDSPEFLEIFRFLFDKKGYKTYLATDYKTAKNILDHRSDHIEFCVLDYDLGVGTGDDVAKYALEKGIDELYLVSGEPSRADHKLYTKVYDKRDLVKFLDDMGL